MERYVGVLKGAAQAHSAASRMPATCATMGCMELASQDAHRALAYIGAARRYGADIDLDDVREFLRNRPEFPFQMVAGAFTEMFNRQRNVLKWLQDVRWVAVSPDGRVRLTDLGHAMLRHAEAEEREVDEVEDVVLDPDDEIAYAKAVERIASAGRAILVDPYFRVEQLLTVLQHTKVDRLLTSARGGDGDARVSGLTEGIGRLTVDRSFEIRKNDEMHDRFVVPDSGPVLALGTSMGGIGQRFSVMVNINPPTADHVRDSVQTAWDKGEEVASAEPVSDPDADEAGANANASD